MQCDVVAANPRLFFVKTQYAEKQLRAKNQSDRDAWVFFITKEATLLREYKILEEAEIRITKVTQQNAERQTNKFHSIISLGGCKENKDLLCDYAEYLKVHHPSILVPDTITRRVLEESIDSVAAGATVSEPFNTLIDKQALTSNEAWVVDVLYPTLINDKTWLRKVAQMVVLGHL
eukprot:Platyproteum_vivax@DN4946_c0_g1_i1.p1